MGAFGYAVFGEDTKGVIISNFSSTFGAPFKLFLVAHLILYIPIEFVVMRFSLLRLFGHTSGKELPLPVHCIVTVIILAGTVHTVDSLYYVISIVISVPAALVLILRALGLTQGAAFGFILDFTGGFAASMTSFVIPAAIYLKLTSRPGSKYYWETCAMLRFGCFIVPTMSILIITGAGTY